MDYSTMKMEDLRKEGRQAGFSSKFVTFASKNDLLNALMSGQEPQPQVGGDLADILAAALQGKIQTSGIDEDAVRDIVKNEIAGLSMPVRLEITNTTGAVTATGNCHFRLKEIITLANIREDLLLVGPAGSGKTHACHMAADALNLPFYFTSVGQQTTKSDLMGYMSATGTYVSTLLRRAYEHGGVFLLDEIDAGNSNVIISLNALLANGAGAFPDGMINRHPDFICIAAANTFGHGGNSAYVGRNQLDASSLDRFSVLDFPYDEVLELAISPMPDFTRTVQRLRTAAAELKERIIISPRASIKGGKMLQAGFSESDALNAVLWKGVNSEIISRVSRHAGAC